MPVVLVTHHSKRARVISVARGRIIDEPALIEALASGQPAGAYLDVFAPTPFFATTARATRAESHSLTKSPAARADENHKEDVQ